MDTSSLYEANTETTFYGRVLQEIIRKDGFAQNLIEIYNNEVMNKIPEAIHSTVIPTADGEITFENMTYDKPYQTVGGKERDITPLVSRMKTTPYFAKMKADIVFKPNPVGRDLSGNPIYAKEYINSELRKNVYLGEIPVMLGSDICHLSKKNLTPLEKKEEAIKLGECFNDPLGYFIVKSERLILTQESLRFCSIMIYYEKKNDRLESRYTIANDQQGSTVVQLNTTKHLCVHILLQHLRCCSQGLSVFLIFRILGLTPEQALEKIFEFIKPEHRQIIYFQAQPSIAEFQAIQTDTLEGYINYILRIRIRERGDMTGKVILENQIVRDIENDLFCNIPDRETKLTQLALFTAKTLECMAGIRKEDDRDSWANKQLRTAGFSISYYFRKFWSNIVQGIKQNSSTMNGLKAFTDLYKNSEIGNRFIAGFGPQGFGNKNGSKTENITDSLKRETPLSVYSQVTHINSPLNRQSKTLEIRSVHPSQLGYICLYDTPEGENVGLVNHLACTCYISLERNVEPILALFKEGNPLHKYLSKNKKNSEQVPLLINGVIRGWTEHTKLLPVLQKMRQDGSLYKDICLFYNSKDSIMEISCSGGRPTRPLFVVDPENYQLVVVNKKLENEPLDVLIKEGCIEYIDSREQEYILISQTMEEMQRNHQMYQTGQTFHRYTHCEIDPYAIFSISASLVPMANRQNGPRTSFQANMFKQALGQFHTNEHRRFDTSFKMIYYPTKAIFQNDSEEIAGLNYMPTGTTLQVAIMANPDNAEDGIVFKEEAVKYGNIFDMCKKITVTSIAKIHKDYTENFKRPIIVASINQDRFHAIEENGLPKLDAFIRQGECIIGKVRKNNKTGQEDNISEYAPIGAEGYVDRISITTNRDENIVVRVKIRKNRKYIPGDKLACLSPDHSVFTKDRRWVPITQLSLDHEVATLNAENKLEWQKPSAIHHYTYQGDMYYIQGRYIDQLVTPEHRMYLKKFETGKYSFDNAKNCLKSGENFFTIPSYEGNDIKTSAYVRVLPYEGSVHCITVPNGIFYVRRNGLDSWTGNSRYSQKGTVSKMVPARLLPRVSDGPNKGMVPDIIINPHGQSSRMTIGKILEIKTTKAALISGKYINSTTFRDFTEQMEFVEKTLGEYGLDIHGKENFELPNGIPLRNRLFFGPCYYQALRHHVSDKIQMRARGSYNPRTRQPESGRSKEGGLRIGEMERDALISHGSSALLRERMCDMSDAFNVPICGNCGTIAIVNHITKVYICKLCGDKAKFGIIRIPYVTKLLLHYLNASGIHMTFKTEHKFQEMTHMEEKFLD